MLSWYALNTKPNCEQLVCKGLRERGIETYFPVWRAGRAARAKSFFPCYIFVHADLELIGRSTVRYLPGVRHFVSYGDQPARMAPEVIRRLEERLSKLEQCARDARGAPLQTGDRVQILGGPFQGFDAIFDRNLAAPDRVRLLLHFIQKQTPLEIDRQLIERKHPGGWMAVRLPAKQSCTRISDL